MAPAIRMVYKTLSETALAAGDDVQPVQSVTWHIAASSPRRSTEVQLMQGGWSRTARYLALVMVLAGMVGFLLAARALVWPLIIAATLAYVLKPAVTLMTARTGLKHNTAVILVFLLFLVVLAVILVAFVPVVVSQGMRLSHELRSVRAQLEGISARSVTFLAFELPIGELLEELDSVSSQLFRPERVFRVLRATTSNLLWILVILVTGYHLLQDWERLREWLIHLAPEAYQPDVRRLHREIKDVWRAYLRGQLLLMLSVGVLTGLGSAAIGLPGAVAFGLLAGALDLVPSLGPTATMVVAAVVAWFEGSTFLPLSNAWFTVVVVALYILVQLVENVWLQPRILGRILRLHPALVFVAVVGALSLAGALVALIIVPLLGTVGVLGRYVHRRILCLQPWPEVVDNVDNMDTVDGCCQPSCSPAAMGKEGET